MSPEANRFLDKAQRHLENAATMLGVGLNEDGGRTVYLAGFHAAQAFIFEKTGRVLKSHRGVHTEFLRLSKDNSEFAAGQRIFLSQSYNFKAIADYETGSGSEVSQERAASAVEAGSRFVNHVAALLQGLP